MAQIAIAPQHFLSVARIALGFCVYSDLDAHATSSWALPAAVGAVALDIADGRVARARGTSSATGRLVDNASDAAFLAFCFSAFAPRDRRRALDLLHAGVRLVRCTRPAIGSERCTTLAVPARALGRGRELRARGGRRGRRAPAASSSRHADRRVGCGCDPPQRGRVLRQSSTGLEGPLRTSLIPARCSLGRAFGTEYRALVESPLRPPTPRTVPLVLLLLLSFAPGCITPISKGYEIHTADLTCDEANRQAYAAVLDMGMQVSAFRPAKPGAPGSISRIAIGRARAPRWRHRYSL